MQISKKLMLLNSNKGNNCASFTNQISFLINLSALTICVSCTKLNNLTHIVSKLCNEGIDLHDFVPVLQHCDAHRGGGC